MDVLADEVVKLIQDMMLTEKVRQTFFAKGEIQRAALARRQLELQARQLKATLNVAQIEMWKLGEIGGDFPEPLEDEDVIEVATEILTILAAQEKKK